MEQQILAMFFVWHDDIKVIASRTGKTQTFIKEVIGRHLKPETENYIILPSKLNDM